MTEGGNIVEFVRGNRHRLDMDVDSAYTTEFLDGPEEFVMRSGYGG
jgi:hypothetical protein